MATQKPHKLANGVDAHILTDEERRRGRLKGHETRRERAKSFRERLAEKLDERAEEIADRLLAAGDDDWRAITAALDQAFGKPTETVKAEIDTSVRVVSAFDADSSAAVQSDAAPEPAS